MNSQLTSDFVDRFAKLPKEVKNQARRCYQLWQANPSHPSLQFKKIHNRENLYSVRIGLGWRALGLVDDKGITWFWIGSHAEYDKLISN